MTYMKTYVICSYKAYTQAHVFLLNEHNVGFHTNFMLCRDITTYIARFWQRIVKG